jgi:hypothetical protein
MECSVAKPIYHNNNNNNNKNYNDSGSSCGDRSSSNCNSCSYNYDSMHLPLQSIYDEAWPSGQLLH